MSNARWDPPVTRIALALGPHLQKLGRLVLAILGIAPADFGSLYGCRRKTFGGAIKPARSSPRRSCRGPSRRSS
eukprot:7476808-Pyramimonas_sp.AAC.1